MTVDPSVVRGLGYYTGPVFEADLTSKFFDDAGVKQTIGSIAGGGRYDDLIKRFTGQEVPAVGISLGVDRLLTALNISKETKKDSTGPVIVTVMERDKLNLYQKIVSELRSAGIKSEVYMGNPKNFGNQLKYADKRNSPIAVIVGSEEYNKGVVQLKDLVLGSKISKDATLEEWKSQPAQKEVKREDLVGEVSAMLDKIKKS